MASNATFQTLSVSRESRRRYEQEQQRNHGAQGNQKSISRQDKAAELEEMGCTEERKTKPTHWAVKQCAGEPVLRRWDSPQLFRHSGRRTLHTEPIVRVESRFDECWFNQR